jgi:type I restriction enzyme M protein
MESCIVICRSKKPKAHQGTVLFIDAINDVTRERSHSYLSEENQKRITEAFTSNDDVDGFSKRVKIDDIESQNFDLTVHRYVERISSGDGMSVAEAVAAFQESNRSLRGALSAVVNGFGEKR